MAQRGRQTVSGGTRARQQAARNEHLRQQRLRNAASDVVVGAVYVLPALALGVSLAYGLHLVFARQWEEFRALAGLLVSGVVGYLISDLKERGIRKD